MNSKNSKFAIFAPTTTSEDMSVYVGHGNWEYVNTNSQAWLNADVGALMFDTEHEANDFITKHNLDDCQAGKVADVLSFWENE